MGGPRSRVQSVSHVHFFFPQIQRGRHWFRAACIYGLTYVTYSNHIWTWANSLKTSWKMGNYQNKIPQSDVWFHFPIWFKVGTLIIIRRIWVCCWLTFVLLLARPHPIKEEGPTLLYSRSIHIYMCIDDDSLEMRYSQLDCVDLSRLYFCVCNPLDNIRVAEWLIEKEKLRRR
jgi:hypothetical protein